MSAFLALLVAAHAVHASSFRDTTLEQLAVASDAIVEGTVLSARVHASGPGRLPGIHTEVRLRVERTLGGEPRSNELVFWAHGGRLGERMRVVQGQARFRHGERLVMFLFRDPYGNLWPTGMGRGKWLVSDSAAGSQLAPSHPLHTGRGGGVDTALTHDPREGSVTYRSQSGSADLTRISLAELEARVYAARGGM